MNPKVTIAELQNQKHFKLVEEFEHGEIFKFLSTYYYIKRSWVIDFHFLLSFSALCYWILFGMQSGYSLSTWVVISGWSAITMIVIILPIHEILRLGIYRLLGARLIRFYFSFKKIYALAFAYDFVFSPREICLVAIITFLVLNMGLLAMYSAWESTRFYFLAILGINIGAGSKDFAMLNYHWMNRNKKLYSYDSSAGKSYIFEKISELRL
jgi:hypothetical protein